MQLTYFFVAWLLPAMALAQDPPSPTTTTLQTSTTTTATTTTTTAAVTPSPTMPGLAPDCDGFHKIITGDNCYGVTATYNITMDQLYEWNTLVNDACTNLWAGYYMCVHVPGAQAPTEPTPQMPGVVENCKKFHLVQSGESCWSIYTAAGITFEQFRSWNKEINSACGNLWPNFYVCTGV